MTGLSTRAEVELPEAIEGATVKDESRTKILIKLEDQDQQVQVVEQLRSMGYEVTTSLDDLGQCKVYYSDNIDMLGVDAPGVHPIVSFGESSEVIVGKVSAIIGDGKSVNSGTTNLYE